MFNRIHRSFFTQQIRFKSTYDAVIIGGGHNGLVAACYLQKSGLKVCVLERRHIVGGCAVTEEIIPGFKFSRASYVLSLLRPHIINDLNLKSHGLKVHLRNPSSYTPLHEKYWTSAKSLTLGRDTDFNYQQIAQFSKKDAQAYEKYEEYLSEVVEAVDPLLDLPPSTIQQLLSGSNFDKVKSIINNKQLRSTISKWGQLGHKLTNLLELMTSPAIKILDQWFESEPLRATLATDSVIGAMASPRTPGTGYVLLHHVMGELEGIKGAWGYPEGGMGGVTKSLENCAKSLGVQIKCDMNVTEILCKNENEVYGVKVENGEEIRSKFVLSNATPDVTFMKLIPKGILNKDFENSIKTIDYTSPVTKINVAVSRLPVFKADPNDGKLAPHHQTTVHLNCESTEMIHDAYIEAKLGNISTRPMLEMTMPSSLDETLCPKGAHVCLIFSQYTPYTLANNKIWNEETKQNYAKQVFSNIDEYAPGFSSSIVGYEVLPPPDLERIFGITGGNIFHGSMTIDQLFLLRCGGKISSPRTQFQNLLICGSGAHPGGGVMGSPGKIAADHLLKLIK